MSPDSDWRRSSFCSDHTCVEVGRGGDRILVRDSKHPEREPLAFTRAEWDTFLSGIAQLNP